MNTLNEYIDAAIDRGLRVTISAVGGEKRVFFDDGFYKSDGLAYLAEKDGCIVLFARYGEETKVNDFSDVVSQSMEWHEHSKDRFDGWINPAPVWADLYKTEMFS